MANRKYQVWVNVRGEYQLVIDGLSKDAAFAQAKLFANSKVTSSNEEQTSPFLKETT